VHQQEKTKNLQPATLEALKKGPVGASRWWAYSVLALPLVYLWQVQKYWTRLPCQPVAIILSEASLVPLIDLTNNTHRASISTILFYPNILDPGISFHLVSLVSHPPKISWTSIYRLATAQYIRVKHTRAQCYLGIFSLQRDSYTRNKSNNLRREFFLIPSPSAWMLAPCWGPGTRT
jgi:hypothetical protein